MRHTSIWAAACLLLIGFFAPLSHAMDLYLSQDEDSGQAYIIANDAMLKSDDGVRIRRFLMMQASKGIPTALYLTSQGGYAELMRDYARAIVEPSEVLYKRFGLYNVVVINEECSSACIILTSYLTNTRNPKALQIVVSYTSRFGFHSPVDVNKAGVVVPIKNLELRERAILKQIGWLKDAGVNPEWLKKNEALVREFGLSYLSGMHLCMEATGIIPRDSCVTTDKDIATMVQDQLQTAIVAKNAPIRPELAPTATDIVLIQQLAPQEVSGMSVQKPEKIPAAVPLEMPVKLPTKITEKVLTPAATPTLTPTRPLIAKNVKVLKPKTKILRTRPAPTKRSGR